MNVQDRIRHFLNINNASDHKLIIAVSGGKDSMTLLHACFSLGLNIVAAHCNFNLRGNDSVADHDLVTEYCHLNRIGLETINYDPGVIFKNDKTSIQETARDLRYEWFESIRVKTGASYILTAHQANDVAETFLFNLLRGSGADGLSGIPAVNGVVLRPMLDIFRSEIDHYTDQFKVPYRTDLSNLSDLYSRNYIRNQVLPALEHINPKALAHIVKSAGIIHETNLLAKEKCKDLQQVFCSEEGGHIFVNVDAIRKTDYGTTLLRFIVEPFGFNQTQITDMFHCHTTGSVWMSSQYHALLNRGKLVVSLMSEKDQPVRIIYEEHFPDEFYFAGCHYLVHMSDQIPKQFEPGTIYFDAELIQYPVTIRSWLPGDKFVPLGMSNQKKVSDFFIDMKLSLLQKKEAFIIEHHAQVIGVIPYRVDDRFRINKLTQKVLSIKQVTKKGS